MTTFTKNPITSSNTKNAIIKRNCISVCCFLALSAVSTHAFAEACTYNEAILALKQGNEVRGMALLTMAARDGDDRAVNYLALRNSQKSADLVAYKPSQD